jgi:hypothetical protein
MSPNLVTLAQINGLIDFEQRIKWATGGGGVCAKEGELRK